MATVWVRDPYILLLHQRLGPSSCPLSPTSENPLDWSFSVVVYLWYNLGPRPVSAPTVPLSLPLPSPGLPPTPSPTLLLQPDVRGAERAVTGGAEGRVHSEARSGHHTPGAGQPPRASLELQQCPLKPGQQSSREGSSSPVGWASPSKGRGRGLHLRAALWSLQGPGQAKERLRRTGHFAWSGMGPPTHTHAGDRSRLCPPHRELTPPVLGPCSCPRADTSQQQ